MSKVKYSVIITLAVLIGIAIYSCILFLNVSNRNEVFYINYGFTVFSFIAFLGALLSVLIKPKDLDTAFLNEPYVSIAIIYAVTQFIFGIWTIFHGEVTWQQTLSLDILFCGLYLICLLFLIAGISLNKEIEANIKEKRSFLSSIQIELKNAPQTSSRVQKALDEFIEEVRFSDPMSHDKHKEIETQIIEDTKELIENINNETFSLKKITQLKKLLKKRNDCIKNS